MSQIVEKEANDYEWFIYRDCDTWRLRKIVIELWDNGANLIHRTRMFYPWFLPFLFKRRLERRKKWMLKVANEMRSVAQSG